MADALIESQVRQWLREHQGAAQCARCLAIGLNLDYAVVQAAMDDLAPRRPFARGPCACGATGLSYGWADGTSAEAASAGHHACRIAPAARWIARRKALDRAASIVLGTEAVNGPPDSGTS